MLNGAGRSGSDGWCPICQVTGQHLFIKREPAAERPIGDPDLDSRLVDVVRCAACGAVFVSRDFPEELIERFYVRETGGGIAINIENFGWWLQNTEKAIESLLAHISDEPRGDLLDIGCGRGTLVYLARRHGWIPTGLDLNVEMASFVRGELGINAFAGDVFSADLPEGHFAAITLFDVLEHVYAPVRMLERCRQLLRPGGVVVVKSPHWRMQLLKERLKRSVGRGSGNIATIGHINQFDEASLSLAFVKAGMEPVGVFPSKVFLPGMRGAPFRMSRTVEYTMKAFVNIVTDVAFKRGGVNVAFSILGIARTPLTNEAPVLSGSLGVRPSAASQ